MIDINELCDFIGKKLNIDADTIEESTKITDLDLDSLGIIELIMNIEDEYGIELDDDRIDWTIKDLWEFIRSNNASN